MILWIEFFALSIAAIPALLFVGIVSRKEVLSDASLYAQFTVVFSLTAFLMYGLLQQPAIRRQVDPAAQLAHEIESHPVLMALKQHRADPQNQLRQAVEAAVAAGLPVAEAVRLLHPQLAPIAREKIGWTDPDTRLAWMALYVDQLRHLRQAQPEACADYALLRPGSFRVLAGGLDPALAERFEAGFVQLLDSAALGLAEKHPRLELLDFNAFQRLYREQIHAPLESRYGRELASRLSTPLRFAGTEPPMPADALTICNARLEQLRRVREQAPAEAARMFHSLY